MGVISIPQQGHKDFLPSDGLSIADLILLLENGSRNNFRNVVFMQQKSDDGNCPEYA
jgi:hypothetical protein